MPKENIKALLQATMVKDVMTSPVITLNDADRFVLAYEKFSLYGIRHMPVVNEIGALVGLITQRALYKIHSPRRLDDGTWYYDKDMLNQFILKKVMIPDPFTLSEDKSLFDAVDAMVNYKYGCVIIVDGLNRPSGILTPADVLKWLFIA